MKSELSVGFDFTAIWFDEGRIQLCISAWNGSFGGTIEVYEAHGKLEKAAGTLAGFPLNPSDEREIVFGNFDFRENEYAGIGIDHDHGVGPVRGDSEPVESREDLGRVVGRIGGSGCEPNSADGARK